MTDEELVSKIVSSNDAKLFGILYDRFSKNIYNKCYSFVNNEDEAKDLTQDIFLKLFVKLSSFKGNSKFSTWVYSFTYNHCVNYVTRSPFKKHEVRLTDTYKIDNYSEEIEMIDDDYSGEKLNRALKKISADDRSILLLKYQDDLTIKNLMNLMGISSSAVKMRIKRARERLAYSYAS
ncbi:sigma-70 family RNA polymerase sigma factor [uncultured Algibacter sp.]|uniref:RNA polymerase sigma factor n=1 Tax=uncultured Algibacter sp. TaxID=298659 RepID=UPI0030EE7A3B